MGVVYAMGPVPSVQEPWKEPLGLCAPRSEFLFFKVTLTPLEGSLQTLWPADCGFSRDKKTVWFSMTQPVLLLTLRFRLSGWWVKL